MNSLYEFGSLPVEIWHLIFLEIKEPQDLANLSNCSRFLRELLLDLRVHFLVPKVFDALCQLTTGKIKNSCGKSSNAHLNVYKLESDSKLKQAILRCRLVGSTWNAAVEHCLERPLMAGNTTFVEDIYKKTEFLRPDLWHIERFTFYHNAESASQFLLRFEKSHRLNGPKNPFLGRCVHIEVTLDPVNEEVDFVISVENILRSFGDNIWFLNLFVTSKRSSICAIDYIRLIDYISCCPNLRYLFLRLNTHGARQITPALFVRFPFPKLKYLEVLEVGDMQGLVLDEILSKNIDVKYFGMHEQRNYIGRAINELTLLRGFSAESAGELNASMLDWIERGYGIEILKLEQRCSDFDIIEHFTFFTLRFAESLKDITLVLHFPVNQQKLFDDTKQARLQLPNLRRLSVQFSGVHFIDFILPLQNLEVFELSLVPIEFIENYYMYKERIVNEQIIQFIGYERRMHESNIWNNLLKLAKIVIKFGHSFHCFEYTRRY